MGSRIGKSWVAAAILGALMLMATQLGTVQAAPVEQACRYGAFRQDDMVGVFVSQAAMMRVEIYACGGTFVQWENAYGSHFAMYAGTNRLPGGGIAASKMAESVESLDGTNRIGFKPAEIGFIQVITVDDYGQLRGLYRLQKIS